MTKVKVSKNQQSVVSKTKKEKSREKEYRRAQNINGAFEDLQQRIPYLKPEERRHLPKIKTLRLAMQYITHLSKLLDGNEMYKTDCEEPRPLAHSDFRLTVAGEMRIRNSYRERAHEQEMDPATVQRILAREEQRGRRYQVEQENMEGYIPRPFGVHSENAYNYPPMTPHQFHQTPMQNQMTPSPPNDQYYYEMPMNSYPMMENAYSYQ